MYWSRFITTHSLNKLRILTRQHRAIISRAASFAQDKPAIISILSIDSKDQHHHHNKNKSTTTSGWFGIIASLLAGVTVSNIFISKQQIVRCAEQPCCGGCPVTPIGSSEKTCVLSPSEIASLKSRSVVSISRKGMPSLSGFIVSDDGLIITTASVVQYACQGKLDVLSVDGKKYVGTIEYVGRIPGLPDDQLAIIKIRANDIPKLQITPSSDLTKGYFKKGVLNHIHTKEGYITFAQRGGPIMNTDGAVVGVNAMNIHHVASFIIWSDSLNQFLQQARLFKNTGADLVPLTPPVAELVIEDDPRVADLDIDGGVLVWKVDQNKSPAYCAGLQKYDVIKKIDGEPVGGCGSKGVECLIGGKNRAVLNIQRNGKSVDVILKPRTGQCHF